MWHANIIAGVAVFLLGVATTVLAWLTLPYTGDFGPGPGFVPLWLGITLMACSVPVIITDLRTKERSERLFRPETAKCLRVLILVVTVFLSLPVLGFSVAPINGELAVRVGNGLIEPPPIPPEEPPPLPLPSPRI